MEASGRPGDQGAEQVVVEEKVERLVEEERSRGVLSSVRVCRLPPREAPAYLFCSMFDTSHLSKLHNLSRNVISCVKVHLILQSSSPAHLNLSQMSKVTKRLSSMGMLVSTR